MTYSQLLNGFVVTMTDAQAIRLAKHPDVIWVEENAEVSIASSPQPIPSGPIVPNTLASLWYLDRLDQPTPTAPRLDQFFNFCSTGSGVRAYVVDTGIMSFHKELSGRVDTAPSLGTWLNATNLPNPPTGDQCWEGPQDFKAAAAHGTAVASLIGGNTFGVAKGVTLVDARAFPCSGLTNTAVINKVLEWIPTDPNRGTAARVVNLSFSFLSYADSAGSNAMKAMIDSLVNNYNIKVVAAAGNENDNVYWYAPASAGNAITIAGLNQSSDTRWQYSNYGNTTAFYAPAQYVESAYTEVTELFPSLPRDQVRSEAGDCSTSYPHDTCTSGTSFSAPLATGVIARYLQTNPTATRSQVVSFLNSESTSSTNVIITDPQGGTARVLNLSDCQ